MSSLIFSFILILVLLKQRINLAQAQNKKDSNGAYFVVIWITLIIVYFMSGYDGSVLGTVADTIIMLMSAESLFRYMILSDGLEYDKVKDKALRELKWRLKEMETDMRLIESKKNRSHAAQKELERLEEEAFQLDNLIDWYEKY